MIFLKKISVLSAGTSFLRDLSLHRRIVFLGSDYQICEQAMENVYTAVEVSNVFGELHRSEVSNWGYTLESPVELSKISIFDSYPRPTKSLASWVFASLFLNVQMVTDVHSSVITVKLNQRPVYLGDIILTTSLQPNCF